MVLCRDSRANGAERSPFHESYPVISHCAASSVTLPERAVTDTTDGASVGHPPAAKARFCGAPGLSGCMVGCMYHVGSIAASWGRGEKRKPCHPPGAGTAPVSYQYPGHPMDKSRDAEMAQDMQHTSHVADIRVGTQWRGGTVARWHGGTVASLIIGGSSCRAVPACHL